MRNSKIVGLGHYVPRREVRNSELEKLMDTSDDWIRERTGIKSRRWIEEGESIAGMSHKASLMALEHAGIEASEIDLIITASIIGDHLFPGNSCFLQEKLGLPGVPAIDVRNACSGFLYALAIADKFLKTGTCQNALVVGAEIQSTSLDVSTRGRAMSVIFGDGAGAVVMTASDESHKGILATHLHADGRYANKLWCELPSAAEHPRIMAELPRRDGIYPHMDGPFVFKHAIVRFPEVIQEALDSAEYSVEDLDLVIPHQANLRITEAVAKRMGIPQEKMYSNIQRYGNTTAASIPIALSEAFNEGLIEEDALVCMAAFGAGFTWASALVRW